MHDDTRITRRIWLCAAALALAAFGTDIPGAAAQEYTMKLAHVLAPGSPRDQLLTTYAANLAERTDGRIKAVVYPSGQLGDNRQVIEGLQLGTVEGTINPVSFMGGFEPLLTVFDLPFLFRDADEASRVANSEVGHELMQAVEAKGIKGLAFYYYGDRIMSTKFPVRTVDDFKGRKLRIIASPVFIATATAWGANPVPIPFGETYNALAQGLVEGQEQSWDLIRDMKFYEVSEYMTATKHGHWIDFFFVSKKWYDSLPADLQQAVVEEAEALIPERLKWGFDYMDAAIAELRANPDLVYYEPTPEERDTLRVAVEPSRAAYVEQTGERGQSFVDKFDAAVK